MSFENTTGPHPTGQPAGQNPDRTPAKLPLPEAEQPDPLLQMSQGRMHVGGYAFVGLVIAVVLAFVFYGLNSPGSPEHAPAAPAAHTTQPAAGGNSGAPTPGAPRATRSGGG